MSSSERFWPRRLRWRLRGAWQWPVFAGVTLLDGLVIHLLPITGGDVDFLLAVIFASFGNLFLIGVATPWLARRLPAREAGATAPPAEVVHDRTGTALLCTGTLALLVAGLALQPVTVSETEETEENGRLVRAYVEAHGNTEVRRNLETANTLRLGDGFFRTCIALDDRSEAYCLFVDVNADPPEVREDPNPAPNSEFPGAPG